MNTTVVYIVAQIIGFIAFFISLLAYHHKSKSKILTSMILSNFLNLIHYLLLGAFSGCATKIIAILRDSFVIAKEKNKILSKKYFIYIFIFMYVVAGIMLFENIFSIFPIIAAVIYMIFIWDGDEVKVKKAALFCFSLWLGYNMFVLSISGIISNIMTIISTYIALLRFKKNT